MSGDVTWREMNERPPINRRLLIIAKGGFLGEAYYFEHQGEALRAVANWIYEGRYPAGETLYWALLPTKDEVKELSSR